MLRALVEQLWTPEGDDWPVRVTYGDVPAGHRVVERYAVVPSVARPQFLVPLLSRRSAAGSLRHYNGLRWARLRVPRTILGIGFGAGVAPAVLRHRLLVCVPDDLPTEKLPEYLLSAHLAQMLGQDELALGIGVRTPDPNLKPTLQLFARDGRPVAYAKVGWNTATREMTEREADALTAVASDPGNGAEVPALLHRGAWHRYRLTVTAPLPLQIKRHRDADVPPPAPFELTSRGLEPVPLLSTAFWRSLRAEAAVLVQDDDERKFAALMDGALSRVEAEHADTRLPVGRWHGDWVPWNIGHHAGRVHVFDWEHSAPEAPVGLDLLHWRFQCALVLRGRPLPEAVAAVETSARTELTWIPEPERALMSRLYLLEMFMRTYHLQRLGGGWNDALFPDMLPILEAL